MLFTIVTGHLWGICCQGSRGQGTSICLLVTSSPKKLARSIGSDGALPKSLAKSHWTCLCADAKGGNSATALVENEGNLWHALEHCLSASYSWIPAARGEAADHLRSGLTAHLWAVGAEGLGRVRSTCQVCWKSKNVTLVVRDSDTNMTHSSGECSYAENENINPWILITL